MAHTQVSDNTKLNVIFRVEPGSLGPQGMDFVEDYCQRAQQELGSRHEQFVRWQFVPRYDKGLPEIEYGIAGKKMSGQQAEKYLTLFEQDKDDFEGDVAIAVSRLINEFFGR